MSPKTLEAYRRDVAAVSRHSWPSITAARRRSRDLAKLTPAGRARVHGGAARRRHRQPLADARPGGRALVRALSGAQRQGQGRGADGGARTESAEDAAEAARRSRPPSASPMPTCAPARSANRGSSPATPPCWRCFTARACASPKRSGSRARRAAAGHGRRHHRHRQGQQERMVPVLPVVARSDRRLCRAVPYDLPGGGPLFVGARRPAVAAHHAACHGTVTRRA